MNLNLPFVKRSIIENIVTENVVLPQINASKVIECAFLQFCVFPGNCLKKEICYLEYFHGINDVYPEIKIHCAFLYIKWIVTQTIIALKIYFVGP